MVISNAKLTVLAAVLAAAGAILNSIEAPPFIAILWTVACMFGLFLGVCKLRSAERGQSRPTLTKGARLRVSFTALFMAFNTLGFFEYAQIRCKPAANDLVEFSGRDVIFVATANREECKSATRELTLNCQSLQFPRAQALSGKTILNLFETPEALAKINASTSSSKNVQLRIRGHVFQPRRNSPPWEYDKRRKLAALGIFSLCHLDSKNANSPAAIEIGERSESKDLPDKLSKNYDAAMIYARNLIVGTHRKYLPAKLADLLSSMVLGNRAVELSEETTHKFRDVGLSHILAASGFNLTIVTIMAFALCRLVTPSVVLVNGVCFFCMLAFVSLAGPSPSVIRAALMCTIMLITKSGQRKTLVLPAIALAFLLTVMADPLCTNDLGLQLSYAATVGIVLGSKALTAHLYSGKSKWRLALADAIAVVLIAQFSVMPIQLFFFWKAGTMFIPANLLVTPLVTPLTMVGFASSTLALITSSQPAVQAILSVVIGFSDALAFIPLTIMVLIVNAFARFDAANFTVGPPAVPSIILYYSCFLLLILSLQTRTGLRWAAPAFLITLALLLWRPAPPLLTIAFVHSHTLIINSDHQAIDIDSKGEPGKSTERCFAYNGAKFSPASFHCGLLKSGIRFIQSQKWLLLITDNEPVLYPSQSAEILFTARKMQCDKIIIVGPRFLTNEILPPSEFKPSIQNQDSELKLVGYKNMSGLCFSK